MPEKRLDVKENASHLEKRQEIHEAVHRKNLSGRNLVSLSQHDEQGSANTPPVFSQSGSNANHPLTGNI